MDVIDIQRRAHGMARPTATAMRVQVGRATKPRPFWRLACGLTAALVLSGCADLGYYAQSIRGHVAMLRAARPVPEWLADTATAPGLWAQLALSQRMRAFAVNDLHLPDNASYRRYADLHRGAVVWNVVAAPPDSLTLKTWCFPLAGCVGYRGYFDEAEARRFAADLSASGRWEVDVYGVPAYSTLGWGNWMGGDPLLNTFMHYPEGDLARLIFHELAHQVVYVADDTAFNESFATAVERLGVRRWLDQHASPAARQQYESQQERRAAFNALTRRTRERLRQAYKPNPHTAPAPIDKLAIKKRVFDEFRRDYEALKKRFDDPPQAWAGTDAWVAKANNASFGAQGAYDDWVPAFEALFEREGRDWPRFYAAVKALAQKEKAPRAEALRGLMPVQGPNRKTANAG